ncbi:MAG: nucleoside deaminase [Ruminococcaceae bacterium]|nr:nucleoside deaminase [Oscillospiraceae bacterium]
MDKPVSVSFSERDEQFMRLALEQAAIAAAEGETPVGAVCVLGDRVVSVGRNHRETDRNALAHAELEAIDGACRALGGWRLWQCELYVTLEPCPMCAGAIINSRLRRVVYGASDTKAGSCGSVVNLFELPYNHRPILEHGCLEEECSALLTEFFRQLRITRKDRPKWRPPSDDKTD